MKRIIVISSALLLTLTACKKDASINSKDLFPDSRGSVWLYKHTGANSSDSIEVEITGTRLMGGLAYNIWVNRYLPAGYADTTYEIKTGDSIVNFYYYGSLLFAQYRLPFMAGDVTSLNTCGGDTTRVYVGGEVKTSFGITYDNTYMLCHAQNYCLNSSARDTSWYQNGIGLVKKIQNDYSMGPLRGNGIWELQSYRIK